MRYLAITLATPLPMRSCLPTDPRGDQPDLAPLSPVAILQRRGCRLYGTSFIAPEKPLSREPSAHSVSNSSSMP